MRPVEVIQVGRDEHGITYSADTESAAPAKTDKPKPAVRVRSKRAAEKLGLAVLVEREESLRDLGGGLYEKQPALFAGEWCGSFRGMPPRAYRFEATSLKGLLAQFEDFMRRDNSE